MGKPAGRSSLRRATVRRRLIVEKLGERRVLAAITGAVFEDVNLSFQREVGEPVAPARVVFLDANNNAKLDNGEVSSVTSADGAFRFDNLADGDYLVRLFNGTSSQAQTTPFEAEPTGRSTQVIGGQQFNSIGDDQIALTSQSVVIGDLDGGARSDVALSSGLTKMETLPDGRVLVVGSGAGARTAWMVDPLSGSAETLWLDGEGQTTRWADVVLDGSGRGLLLEQTDQAFALRAVDASGLEDGLGQGVVVTETQSFVPAGTTALSSDTGSRSVLAWSGSDGLQVALWSNVTASFISTEATSIEGGEELLAFDDASGLLAVRTLTGDVGVYDVDGGFASLHTLDGVTGPIAMDGSRELLATVSSEDSALKMFSLRNGGLIADLDLDLSEIGAVSALSLSDNRSLTILGAAGLTEIALRKPAAREVSIRDGQDPDAILFGVALTGANTAPMYESTRVFSTDEDGSLVEASPAALSGSVDLDDDEFVLVQKGQARNGTAVVGYDGSISYTPDPDFNGTDSVVVQLHDGRDASAEIVLNITVNAVPDLPTDVDVKIDPVPEDVEAGTVIGTIEVIDADGAQNHGIDTQDGRFTVQGGQIIFVGGLIDFESEAEVSLAVIVSDPELATPVERVVAFGVGDANDPITAITPKKAQVPENSKGGFVAFIGVDDQDSHQTHTITVDDERFEVTKGAELKLIEGVSLDHETEPSVVVNVTAKEDIAGGNSLTQEITIAVGDMVEGPHSIQLSNDTVLELVAGDIVGDVTLDGGIPDERFELSVDDPRFEIIQGTLKLHDDQFVEFASQSEIELEITASDSIGEFDAISEKFLIQVIENESPHHNHDNPYDVDHSGEVTALDALAIINYLNTYGPGPVGPTDTGYCYDVNADAMVTALDALLVLNEMNRLEGNGGTVGRGAAETGAEGEDATPPTSSPAPPTKLAERPTTPADVRNEDQVFTQLGDHSDVPVDLQTTTESGQQASLPAGESESDAEGSPQDFAQNVDESIRLLSDRG